jgi:hypothetical protein
MMSDFCAFILSHGRADNVRTHRSLRYHGYTGKICVVIDNEDSQIKKYQELYGDSVVIFDKAAIAETFDEGDNFGDRRAVIYARNACFEIAERLGIKHFIQLDDDYSSFVYKTNHKGEFKERMIHSLDDILAAMLKFYKSIPALSVAMAQGGDFIGGENNGIMHSVIRRRKCMNSFICSTDRPFKFVGRVNEDVNTYTLLGSRGNVFMTIPFVMLHQLETQKNDGGMTNLYLDSGTYIKSFYTVMYGPSYASIGVLTGGAHERIHHSIRWNNAVPMIIPEFFKKH